MNRTKPYYPIRLKKQAVQMVAAGLLTEDQACQKFKISRSLLRQWQRWYDHFFLQPQTDPDPMAKKKLTDQEKIEQLQKQLKETQQQLKYEKLRSKAFDTMIDVAEEDLNIIIRKKSGAGHPVPNRPKSKNLSTTGKHCYLMWTVRQYTASLLQGQQAARNSAWERPTHDKKN